MLLLDEPSLGLAPILVQEIFRTICEINKQGVTILLVEQNARIALKVAERAYVLETGKIALSGKSGRAQARSQVQHAYLGVKREPAFLNYCACPVFRVVLAGFRRTDTRTSNADCRI